MRIETAYSIGDRVWVPIDGGWHPGQVRRVQYFIDVSNSEQTEATTYRLKTKKPNPPDDVQKRHWAPYDEREHLANESELIKWQEDYAKSHAEKPKPPKVSKDSIYKLHDPRLG